MKINKIVVVVLLSVISICVGKNLLNKTEVKKTEVDKTEVNKIDKVQPILNELIDINMIIGKWNFQETNEYLISFSLEMSQVGNKINGFHCIVSDSGNKDDCPLVLKKYAPFSLIEVSRGSNYIEFKIDSGFTKKTGIARIELIDENTALWKVIVPIVGENYFPKEGTLKKFN